MIYLNLFWSFFQIGLFSIGGGYAALPLIQQHVVDIHSWLTLAQFGDIITISQMTPGPIAINSATFVGTQIAGVPGAIAATLGCIFPSCIIVLTLAFIYYKYRDLKLVKGVLFGLRPAVVALIASAGVTLLLSAFWGTNMNISLPSTDWIAVFIFATAFVVLRKWKPNPIIVMACAGVLGLICYSIFPSGHM